MEAHKLDWYADFHNEKVRIMDEKPQEPEWTVIEYQKQSLYSTKQVAEIVNRSPSTIRMAIINDRITPVEMPGRDNYFTPEEVKRFAETYKIAVKFQETT